MTGTDCGLFTHKSSRSYLNQLVLADARFYVTPCYHYTPECLPEQEGFILCISKVTNYIWENDKNKIIS